MASAAAATAGDAPDAASARASRPSSPDQRVHENSKQLSPGNVRRKIATIHINLVYHFVGSDWFLSNCLLKFRIAFSCVYLLIYCWFSVNKSCAC